jgi:hypothetical protein
MHDRGAAAGCAVARCTIENARARTRLARRDTSQKGAHHRRRPSCRAGPGTGQTTLHRHVSRRTPRFGTGRSPPWPTSKKPPRPGCTGTTPTDSCTASADAHQPKPRPTTTLRPTQSHKLRCAPNPGRFTTAWPRRAGWRYARWVVNGTPELIRRSPCELSQFSILTLSAVRKPWLWPR